MPAPTSADSLSRQAPAAMLMGPRPVLDNRMPMPPVIPAPAEDREGYQHIDDNAIVQAAQQPISTFSIDVDTGSYSNVRRFLSAGSLPPVDAVRVEELINYFRYDHPAPTNDKPFAVRTELATTPWNKDSLLLRVGIAGRDIATADLPPANLVFQVDVSGSMDAPDKLPLLRSSLKLLVRQLRKQDRITLVTYAGNTAVVLPPTPGDQQGRIVEAIDSLQSGGSTAGASGIELAYKAAQQGYLRGGINRILLATDGDFNVGVTDFDALKGMVSEKRRSGVALSTLGFGTGNYNDNLMEQSADAGDGAYAYIDTPLEARKVLTHELGATLATMRATLRSTRIQPGNGQGIPPDRLRKPCAARRGFQQRPGRCRRHRCRSYRHRLIRNHPRQRPRIGRPAALCTHCTASSAGTALQRRAGARQTALQTTRCTAQPLAGHGGPQRSTQGTERHQRRVPLFCSGGRFRAAPAWRQPVAWLG